MSAEWISLANYAGIPLKPEDFDFNTYTSPLRVWCQSCKTSHEALDWPITCPPYWTLPH